MDETVVMRDTGVRYLARRSDPWQCVAIGYQSSIFPMIEIANLNTEIELVKTRSRGKRP
jgi:hypothetical protein